MIWHINPTPSFWPGKVSSGAILCGKCYGAGHRGAAPPDIEVFESRKCIKLSNSDDAKGGMDNGTEVHSHPNSSNDDQKTSTHVDCGAPTSEDACSGVMLDGKLDCTAFVQRVDDRDDSLDSSEYGLLNCSVLTSRVTDGADLSSCTSSTHVNGPASRAANKHEDFYAKRRRLQCTPLISNRSVGPCSELSDSLSNASGIQYVRNPMNFSLNCKATHSDTMHAHAAASNFQTSTRPRGGPPSAAEFTYPSAAGSSHQDDNSTDTRHNSASLCSTGVFMSNAQGSTASDDNYERASPSVGSRETEPPAPLLSPSLPDWHPEPLGTHTNVCNSNPWLPSRLVKFVNNCASNQPT